MLKTAKQLSLLFMLMYFLLVFGFFIILNGSLTSSNGAVDTINSNTTIIFDDRELYDKVRVLCWVLTSPNHHATKAKTVKETWGKRCNVILFMSTAPDDKLPAINLPVQEGCNHLWGKTREAFRHVWNNYHDKVDWFFKADDDTYVILENLRYFLSGFNTSMPLWFGHKFKSTDNQGYFSGGAGYVLSKEAARRFVEVGYSNPLICRGDHGGDEDVEIGKCLTKLNVSAMDTRDSKRRDRFFPMVPYYLLNRKKRSKRVWYWDKLYYPPSEIGLACCSDSAISFHYLTPEDMILFEYLIYQVRPYGLPAENRPVTPEPPPDFNLTATPWVSQEDFTAANEITTAVSIKNRTKAF